VFIEVKGGPECIGPLAATLQRSALAPAQITIISFNLGTAAEAKRRLAQHAVCWLREIEDWPGAVPAPGGKPEAAPTPFPDWLEMVIGRCRAAGLNGVDFDHAFPLDVAAVRRIRDAGLRLYVWTVDDPIRAHSLSEAGVDGITTNRPGWLREQLAKIRRERG
jgi:glycerophosphoryl diester phosphodiesterase